MKRSYSNVFVAKVGVVLVCALVSLVGFQGYFERRIDASASGPTASNTGAPGEANCTACHSEFTVNSGTGSVTIGAIPANYLPNQQIPVTVTTAQADAVIYGFQMTAVDSLGREVGTFTLPTQVPPQTQFATGIVGGNQRRYVHHTVDGVIPTQFGSKTWNFTWTAPNRRAGKVSFYVAGNAANSDSTTGGDYIYTAQKATLSGSAISNFDADGTSDIAVWRPSTGVWYSLNTTNNGFQSSQFGSNGDRIAPGDYDGDGKTDQAIFRPSTGQWFIRKSDGSGFIITQFGSNGDIPVVGDYDGDLKSDLAVWRPSTGVWYIFRSSDSTYDIRQFGISTDKIAQGDYDADGKTELAVWRPSTGVWYIWRTTDGGFTIQQFGLNGDKPVQGDYDGDGRADLAIFRPSNNTWYLLRSSLGFTATQFGFSTDIPASADYDGDGLTDVAVYRNGTWYAQKSSGGTLIVNFGIAADVPVASGYLSE
ncbi:MAG: VCBS repeat-containing protein [Acidobacteria bacterium]|nr:VCBS repeat-containing protein [Acidobacteriota bacterium]MBK8150502.1 VCBS repeat-containing protein [Acidobacteriota bacterium]